MRAVKEKQLFFDDYVVDEAESEQWSSYVTKNGIGMDMILTSELSRLVRHSVPRKYRGTTTTHVRSFWQRPLSCADETATNVRNPVADVDRRQDQARMQQLRVHGTVARECRTSLVLYRGD